MPNEHADKDQGRISMSHEQSMSMSDEPQEESMSMGQPDQESMSMGQPDQESMSMGQPDQESMSMGQPDLRHSTAITPGPAGEGT